MSQWIRTEKRKAIYERDEYRCVYCGNLVSEQTASLDHLRPRELDGTNDPRNLVTACISCNASKQDLPLREFLRRLAAVGIDANAIKLRIRRNTARKLKY